ncbi:unnamed protein product [Schistosoma turkestanicum]|nr:unnamed protein product [Schistosoma turkestanicum]
MNLLRANERARRHRVTSDLSNVLGCHRSIDRLPKLIVFDLDFTLWPLSCDTHVSPPFTRKNNSVYDATKKRVIVYSDAQEILRIINESPRVKLACASRTSAINVAQQLLQALNWSDLFDYAEIYPGSKIAHFRRFHELSGIGYADMLFFDDETRNINEISRLGVQCHLVEHGITLNLLEDALRKFQRQRKIHEYI